MAGTARYVVMTLCVACLGIAQAGGISRNPCEPEELRWTARDWQKHFRQGQKAVHDAYAKVEDIEAQRRESFVSKVRVIEREKDEYGDPLYVRYGPRAYADTPCYGGPAYTASFEPRQVMSGTPTYRSLPQIIESSGYVPSAPARSDVLLKPGASFSYVQSGMRVNPGSERGSVSRPAAQNSYY